MHNLAAPLISIVDDDPAMRSSLVDLMASAGYRTIAFPDGQSFLASVERADCECIITDIQMPGLTGFDLKRELDAEQSTAPVIMITARTDLYSERQVKDCGAICFLRKPFEAAALLGCVERALRP